MNITVTDDLGGDAYLNITLTVINVNDAPEILNSPPQFTVEDEVYEFEMEFFDPDPDDTHQWWLEENGDFLSIDIDNGTITGSPGNEHVGEHNITVTIRDAEGDFDRKTYVLEVQNRNDDPVINNNWPNELIEDLPYEFQLIAFDPDPVETEFTWKMSTDASFILIDLMDEKILANPGDYDVGIHWINVTVDDRMGGSDWFNHTFEVININDAPSPIGVDFVVNMFEDGEPRVIDPKELFLRRNGY